MEKENARLFHFLSSSFFHFIYRRLIVLNVRNNKGNEYFVNYK